MKELLYHTSPLVLFGFAIALAVLVLFWLLWRIQHVSRQMDRHHEKAGRTTLYHSFFSSLPFPVWLRNNDMQIIYANSAYHTIVEEDVTAQPTVTLPELANSVLPLAQKALSHNETQQLRSHVVVNGKRRYFELYEMPLFYQDQYGTLGMAHDISEIEEVEHMLKEYQHVQSDLVENAASAIAIFNADTTLRFCNRSYINLWKLDERWLAIKPTYSEILEVLREKRKLPEQADFRQFKKEELAAFTNQTVKQEAYYYLPDGKVLRVISIPHAGGGLLFSYEDMTDQIALERSYNTLLSVKKFTLDNLFEAVAVFGEDGRLSLSNPVYAHMWHIEESMLAAEPHISDLLERTKHLYGDTQTWQTYQETVLHSMQSRNNITQRITRSDGVVLEHAIISLPDGSTLMVYIDITDSMRVEESLRAEKKALEEADSIKTNFISSISYELRSPLTSIHGFTEMLLQRYVGEINPKQEEYLSDILSSSKTLSKLIDRIIDLASIEAGHNNLLLETHDITSLLINVSKHVTAHHHINLDPSLPKEPIMAEVDSNRLFHTFEQLILNAIRCSTEPEKIALSCEASPQGDYTVAITYPTKENEPIPSSLFDYTHTQDFSGTELGLYIAQRIIHLHGGNITLESQQASEVSIICTLPLQTLAS